MDWESRRRKRQEMGGAASGNTSANVDSSNSIADAWELRRTQRLQMDAGSEEARRKRSEEVDRINQERKDQRSLELAQDIALGIVRSVANHWIHPYLSSQAGQTSQMTAEEAGKKYKENQAKIAELDKTVRMGAGKVHTPEVEAQLDALEKEQNELAQYIRRLEDADAMQHDSTYWAKKASHEQERLQEANAYRSGYGGVMQSGVVLDTGKKQRAEDIQKEFDKAREYYYYTKNAEDWNRMTPELQEKAMESAALDVNGLFDWQDGDALSRSGLSPDQRAAQSKDDASRLSQLRQEISAAGFDADRILDYANRLRNQQKMQEETRSMTDFASGSTSGAIAATAASYGSNLLSSIGSVGILAQRIFGSGSGVTGYRPVDYNAPSTSFSQVTSATREAVSAQMGETGQFLYGTLNSAVDSAARMLVAKAIGTGFLPDGAGQAAVDRVNRIVSGAVSAQMSTQVFTDAFLAAKQSGATDDDAILDALVQASIEGITEKYSVDAILKNPNNLVLTALRNNFIAEGSEEIASDFLNTIYDELKNGSDSELRSAAQKYIDAGLDPKEAWKLVLQSYAKQVVLDGLAGGISGIAMGGAAELADYTQRMQAYTQQGQQILDSGNYDTLHALAMNVAKEGVYGKGESDLSHFAEKTAAGVKNLQDNRGSMTQRQVNRATRDVGKLADRVDTVRMRQNAADIQSSLEAKGMSERDAKKAAQLISENYEGLVDPGDKDLQRVMEKPEVRETMKEITENPESSVAQRNYRYNLGLIGLKLDENGVVVPVRSKTEEPAAESVTTAEADKNASVEISDGVSGKVQGIKWDNGILTATVTTEAGETVSAPVEDVSMPSEMQDLVAVSKQFGESAPAVYAAYQPGMGVAEYGAAMRLASDYGYTGVSRSYADSSEYLNGLHPAQISIAYEAGQAAWTKESTETMRTQSKGTVFANRKAGKVSMKGGTVDGVTYKAVDRSGMTAQQKAAVRNIARLAQVTGINFVFYQSEKNSEGKYSGANGIYTDNTIFLDINAGATDSVTEAAILRTAAHELTHFIEQFSKSEYRALQEFMLKNLEGYKGNTIDQLVAEKQARSKKDMSFQDAMSEIVADGCEMMLQDTRIMELLASEHEGIAKKISRWLKNWVEDLKAAFTGVEAVHEEAKAMIAHAEELQKLWDNALMQALRNREQMDTTASDDTAYPAAESVGMEIDEKTESVSPTVVMSERTWTESDYVQERDQAAKEIAKAIGVSVKKAVDYIDSVNSIAKMIAEDRTRLDYFSSPGRSSFVSNVEYGGSFDFSTLCKKRRLLTGTFTAIQKALPNTALTADEILDIRNRMKEQGLEVSCGLCYVEGSRANMGQFANEFLRLYKQYYPDAWQPNMADVNTPEGIEWVRINHPECYEQYEYFWNHYGTLKEGDKNLFASQQKPKLYQLHTEYKGEILQKFRDDSNVEEKNLNGGIRLQSFSDFEIVHLIDTMQIIMDMSRVGLAGQAYTKVPDFAWALGDTGLKINLSLIAKGVDENGRLIFDDVEGMPIDTAVELRNRYSKNVGTILVVFNDQQLIAAMADDRVDFIIPFHRSQWKKSQYEAMGLPAKTKDYTYMQNEKFIKPQFHEYRGRMVKDKATNYMPNEYWDFSKSGKENAIAYLEMCARNNKRPKFYKLLQNNGDGSYSLKADGSTDGYWKLLIDFKMYDNNGVGSPQMPVKPDFNMEEATRMLDEYQGGHSNFPVAQGIVDSFVSEYKEKHKGIKYSDRDLSEKQKEAVKLFGTTTDFNEAGYILHGYDARPEGKIGESALFQDRDPDQISNRSLLANALDSAAKNDIERKRLEEYRGKIDLLNSEEQKLQGLRSEIRELSFAKGPKDTKRIRELQFEANKTANRINIIDRQLLRLEAAAPLQNVLQREKKMAYKRAEQKGKDALAAYREKATKTQREIISRYQESRAKGIDSRKRTAMRGKIRDVVNELNNYLLKGTKDRHVPESLRKAVAEALDAVNMDTVGAEERIAKLQQEMMKAKTPEKIQEIARKIDHIQAMGGKMSERLKKLKDAYDELLKSPDVNTQNSYDEVIHNKLESVIDKVGDTPLRNMTLTQLEDVYDMYRMVLTAVRDVNKSFKDEKKRSISVRANAVMSQVEEVGGKRKPSPKALNGIESFGWNNLKPVYAFEHIGSQTLTEAFKNVRKGEDVWAVDVSDARAFYLDKSRKYHYDSWDFNKQYTFTSTSGMDFRLNLEQILSLYAYSKREQAADHLKYGGIVFDPNTEVVKTTKHGIKVTYDLSDATAYNINDETLGDIISKLTDEQKAFADEMQDYLSTVMGSKGNEVSMEMYGIRLFREQNYFPLKSAQQFMEKARDQAKGEVKIKNSGFSKETVPKAKNPIVLSGFMDVWASHVNDMSMYHAFVLPMEDFYRIYNYKTPSNNENQATEGVNQYIENAYGRAATAYIDQLLKDLNGGARTDPRADFVNKMMGKFKKGAVFASASVVIQQPSTIARATALVDAKYFIGPKIDSKRHKALWEEVKQYAPVAIIKEMGYFDTNIGKSTEDFITGREYSGIHEKAKAMVSDSNYRDEVLSRAPALADEIAWCGIWEAVKRETKEKHPGLDTNAEPFLKLCGDRFTEVITKTQVYDSVLSRSALMRSKDTGAKMVTAFMAEPTTSLNMIVDALVQGKRGNVRYCRTAIGSVIAAQILNSILVSFVYAARDDDDDETYLEKYIGSVSGAILDGLNPLTYIPFIKDIVSVVKGYDVERADMSIVSDIMQAWENLSKDTVTPYRKVEGFAGSIANLFGLPVKNIMRDARSIYQVVSTFMSGQKTTKAGIGYAIRGAITGKTVTNQQQLYDAIMSGDQTQIDRVKGRFKDQSAIDSAIRSSLRENDPRIREAAIAWNANDLDEYMRIAKAIIKEGRFVQDDVVLAIRAEANKLAEDGAESSDTSKAKGLFTSEKFAEAISQGDEAMANTIKTDIIQTEQKNGKTEEEAEKGFNSSASRSCKELFLEGEISADKAVKALVDYCGLEKDEAEKRVGEWAFEADYGFTYSDRGDAYKSGEISASELKTILMETGGKTEEEADLQIQVYDWEKEVPGCDNITAAAIRDYNENCASAGITKAIYYEAWSTYNDIEGDFDSEGKSIPYSKVIKVMPYINSLPLSSDQKTALALCWWGEKTVSKYRLW